MAQVLKQSPGRQMVAEMGGSQRSAASVTVLLTAFATGLASTWVFVLPVRAADSGLLSQTFQIAQATGSSSNERSTSSDTASEAESETSSDASRLDGTRFSCQMHQGQPTVMYAPKSQPDQVYPWATPSALGGGWTPARRCEEIGRRLEAYRPDGLLELQTAVENGYNTICVTTENIPTCRIVLTVPPGQDPLATRDRVFDNLTLADSGEQTQAVNAFTAGSSNDVLDAIDDILSGTLSAPSATLSRSRGIDLRPFLDRYDGGTGTQLNKFAPRPASPTLNPDQFR